MALVLTSTFVVAPPPKTLVESNIVGRTAPTFTMRMITIGAGFIVTPMLPGAGTPTGTNTLIAGRSFPDFPPTPSAPEPWLLGCVQNVIHQRVDITWVDDKGKETSEFTSTRQMLDADPDVGGQMQHLPFVRVSNGSGVPPSAMGLLYGLPGTPTIPVALPAGAGPAWDIPTGGTGPFSLVITDAPAISVFAFKGGGAVSGSPNPIIEVSRSITLQVWLTAVRIGDIGDASKHNILGFTNAFTLKGKYDRRGNPTDAGAVHFEPGDFTQDPITTTLNTGNKSPPSLRPVVSGQLSVAPVVAFLRGKGYSG